MYNPRTQLTTFLGGLTFHFMGQIFQNMGTHLGSRMIPYNEKHLQSIQYALQIAHTLQQNRILPFNQARSSRDS